MCECVDAWMSGLAKLQGAAAGPPSPCPCSIQVAGAVAWLWRSGAQQQTLLGAWELSSSGSASTLCDVTRCVCTATARGMCSEHFDTLLSLFY